MVLMNSISSRLNKLFRTIKNSNDIYLLHFSDGAITAASKCNAINELINDKKNRIDSIHKITIKNPNSDNAINDNFFDFINLLLHL